ncbi:Sel4-like repeat protein [Aquitalea magnusonii]|uniref:Sel4-like repeat protein n=1 Tax=Aquitalea magnusonii TaxID=332411 RepID=A0A3G9GIK9_9NEIS|nr:sel1 repeat family protein [Aquitalea magnusonii]BBF87224.1 Sel4-like repeat protein [Aquitalea magnusonii]
MQNLDEVKANLAFTCVHEQDHLPKLDAEADQLYRYARYIQKNNQLQEDVSVYPELERYYRIATAHGHYKANLELRQMIGKGQAWTADPVKETLDLTQELIDRGIPGGYYDMARYLEAGYGVKQDAELALRYYRKSADMGSPEGQYLVGDKLINIGGPQSESFKVALQMWNCAAQQVHAKASSMLGTNLRGDGKYKEAVHAFQLAVKAGDETAAYVLSKAFVAKDNYDYLALHNDPERSHRYREISDILGRYSYAHPTVPELDDIVPLPPAKLPPWDGKIQWLKDHEANIAPPKPSEALLEKLAKAKGLDPKTGRPLGAEHS